MHPSSTNMLMVNHKLITPLSSANTQEKSVSGQHTWRDRFVVSTLTTLLISISTLVVYLLQTIFFVEQSVVVQPPPKKQQHKKKRAGLVMTVVLENTVFWSPTPNAKHPVYAFIQGTKQVLLHDLAQKKHFVIHLIGNPHHRTQMSSLLANAGVYAHVGHAQVHWADPSVILKKVLPDIHISASYVNDFPPSVKTWVHIDLKHGGRIDMKSIENSVDSAIKLLPICEEVDLDDSLTLGSFPDQSCKSTICVSKLSDWNNPVSKLGQWVQAMDL